MKDASSTNNRPTKGVKTIKDATSCVKKLLVTERTSK